MKMLKSRNFLSAIYGLVCLLPVLYIGFNMLFVLFTENNVFVNGLDYQGIHTFVSSAMNEFSLDLTNINFFTWFANLFISYESGSFTELTILFVNWYFNYIFLVSCGYLLFSILMWFINFSRKLLDRGMNYDW